MGLANVGREKSRGHGSEGATEPGWGLVLNTDAILPELSSPQLGKWGRHQLESCPVWPEHTVGGLT